MKLDNILKSISESRLRSYCNSASWGDLEKHESISKYLKNLNGYQLTLVPLHIYEVSFRNKIHDLVSITLNNRYWLQELLDPLVPENVANFNKIIPNQALGSQTFHHFQTAKCHNDFRRNSPRDIKKIVGGIAKECVRQKNPKIINDRGHLEDIIVSRLHLGFWTQFTQKANNELIRRDLNKKLFQGHPAFNDIPKDTTSIRKFRNKVSHHEPLKGDISYWDELIWKYVSYICSDTRNFFHPYNHS